MNKLELLYPFSGSESITSYSQAWQDIFVLSVLGGLKNGSYLEVGCHEPTFYNNTYLLASQFNWDGISIDILPGVSEMWRNIRPMNRVIIGDALTMNYAEMLGDQYITDYLQLDIEPSTNTLAVLTQLPHRTHRFKVITFETDYYTGGNSPEVRELSRQFLKNLGYTLIVPDAEVFWNNKQCPFEDWYVDMNLVDRNVAESIKNMAQYTSDPMKLLVR